MSNYMNIQKEIDVEDLSTLTKKHLKQICTNSLEEIDRISNSADNSPYKSHDSNYRQNLEEYQNYKDPSLKNKQNENIGYENMNEKKFDDDINKDIAKESVNRAQKILQLLQKV